MKHKKEVASMKTRYSVEKEYAVQHGYDALINPLPVGQRKKNDSGKDSAEKALTDKLCNPAEPSGETETNIESTKADFHDGSIWHIFVWPYGYFRQEHTFCRFGGTCKSY